MSTQTNFSLDISKWVDKTKANAEAIVKDVALETLTRVVQKTPVGNPSLWKHPRKGYIGGTLRQNWQITLDAPATGTRLREDGYFPEQQDYHGIVAGFTMGRPIYIVNNIEYGSAVEYGHSTQAPAGMVRITVVEWPDIVRDAIRSNRGVT